MLTAPVILILINCTICDDNGVMDEQIQIFIIFRHEDGLSVGLGAWHGASQAAAQPVQPDPWVGGELHWGQAGQHGLRQSRPADTRHRQVSLIQLFIYHC